MLKQNLELNDIKNSEIFFGDAKRVFVDFENQNKVFDYVIIDPPRQGCDKEGLKAILKLTKNIVYVSCNPMTLKRDMEILISHGYKVKSIQGFDMFPYTHHIETLCILSNDSETPKSHD